MIAHIASKNIEIGDSPKQRRRRLPDFASALIVGCFALTEETAGSDRVMLHEAKRIWKRSGVIGPTSARFLKEVVSPGITGRSWGRPSAKEQVGRRP
jgi:hypothetical protein